MSCFDSGWVRRPGLEVTGWSRSAGLGAGPTGSPSRARWGGGTAVERRRLRRVGLSLQPAGRWGPAHTDCFHHTQDKTLPKCLVGVRGCERQGRVGPARESRSTAVLTRAGEGTAGWSRDPAQSSEGAKGRRHTEAQRACACVWCV